MLGGTAWLGAGLAETASRPRAPGHLSSARSRELNRSWVPVCPALTSAR